MRHRMGIAWPVGPAAAALLAAGCLSNGNSHVAHPNGPPRVEVGIPDGTLSGLVSIALTLTDPEGDPVDLDIAYAAEGDGAFSPLRALAAFDPRGLEASPEGTLHRLSWDTRAEGLGLEEPVHIQLRLIPRDGQEGDTVVTRAIAIDNAPPNEPPTIAIAPLPAGAGGALPIAVTLADPESDPVGAAVEYALDGEAFRSASIPSAAAELPTSPEGIEHVLVWDTAADGVGIARVERAEIRVLAHDATHGVEAAAGPLWIDNRTEVVPRVLALEPDHGPGGIEVKIRAADLGRAVEAYRVRLAGREARVARLERAPFPDASGVPAALVFVVPPLPATGPVEVQIDGRPIDEGGLLFHASPAIRSIDPAAAPPGGEITLRGWNFVQTYLALEIGADGERRLVDPIEASGQALRFSLPPDLPPAATASLRVVSAAGPSNAVAMGIIPPDEGHVSPIVGRLDPPVRTAGASVPFPIRVHAGSRGPDTIRIEAQYAVDGTWAPATPSPLDPGELTPTAAIGTGAPARFVWDTTADLGPALREGVAFRVRAVPADDGPPGPWFEAPPLEFRTPEDPAIEIVESFEDNTVEDPRETEADWNGRLGSPAGGPGILAAVDPGGLVPPVWGEFHPAGDVVLVTDGEDPAFGGREGRFHFLSLHIPEGVTVRARGAKPLRILVDGQAEILGHLDLDGSPGEAAGSDGPGAGGDGAAGGGGGGDGGSPPSAPDGPWRAGRGVAGGSGGMTSGRPTPDAHGGGGGGGGHAEPGEAGESAPVPGSAPGGAGGIARGLASPLALIGGSGGGGGGGAVGEGGRGFGGGGGGGGGALLLWAASGIAIEGAVTARGGSGGEGLDGGAGGGGGSGGTIRIATPDRILLGPASRVLALGGAGAGSPSGGRGADGRIRFEASEPPVVLDPAPYPSDLGHVRPGPGEVGFARDTVDAGDPGTGALGTFQPAADTILVTDQASPPEGIGAEDGIFEFTDIDVPEGVTVRVTGRNPLVLRASGSIRIAGTIDLRGEDAPPVRILPATPGEGGRGGPGGGDGGRGGHYDFARGIGVPGEPGHPPHGVATGGGGGAESVASMEWPAVSRAGGGGGGGAATEGGPGADGTGPAATRGGAGGRALPVNLTGGGGGGGGGGNINGDGIFPGGTPGAGGGGGGGAGWLVAHDAVTIESTGAIHADGGSGHGGLPSGLAGMGGGGAGGTVIIRAHRILILGGTITALGGSTGGAYGAFGGAGAPGRIRIEMTRRPGTPSTVAPLPTVDPYTGLERPNAATSRPIDLSRLAFDRSGVLLSFPVLEETRLEGVEGEANLLLEGIGEDGRGGFHAPSPGLWPWPLCRFRALLTVGPAASLPALEGIRIRFTFR